jgi:hypothetical protein
VPLDPREQRDGHRLERGHGHVQVEVVAVGGVHVVTDPEARVREQHLAVGHAAHDGSQRPAARRLDARVGRQRLRLRPEAAALQPPGDERVVVVARRDHHLAPRERVVHVLRELVHGLE